MLIGLLLRLPGLGLGLWRDEAVTYFDARPETLAGLIQAVAHSELNPPGFFMIMHRWMQTFGASEVVFKLPALMFGLLLIPVTYGLGLAAGAARAGLMAAAVTALAPEAIYYSQEARPYTLTALLCCVVVLFYLRALAHPRWSGECSSAPLRSLHGPAAHRQPGDRVSPFLADDGREKGEGVWRSVRPHLRAVYAVARCLPEASADRHSLGN
jgi:4-amino-4-deoxy-L-arabinose transferase-like glycosyltransferase